MGVFNVIAFLGALVLAVAGGGSVWWWDHHQPVHWRGPIPLVGPRIDLPDSLLTQRDRSVAEAAAMRAQLGAQQKLTVAAPIVRQAKAAQERAAVSRARVLAVPWEEDTCRFAQQVDGAFMEALSK